MQNHLHMQAKQAMHQHKVVEYYVAGRGAAVVLLHGFGEEGSIWKPQVPHLQKAFKVIVPHLPGTGGSELQPDMRLEGLAEAVKAVLDAEGVTECVLIGHSMGGYVTLAFAEKWGAYVKGFGLFHSTAFADSEEKKATRQKGIEFIRQHGAHAFLKTTVPNLYSPATKAARPALIEEHLQAVQHFTDAALINYYEAMMARPDRTHVLKQARVPVLMVLGRHDAAVPPDDGWTQSHMPQKTYIHMLEESGHMGMVEEVDNSKRLLHDYLIQTLLQTAAYE